MSAAGDDKRCGTKRKAAGSGEAAPADVATLRETIMAHLLTFPEAAALDARQLDDAADRIFRESDPSTATPTGEGMVHYDDKRISSAFNLGSWLEIHAAEDLPPNGEFPPGWLEERRRMLDEEMRPEKRGEPNHSRFHLAKMRVNLLTKGYVELPKPYVDYTPPFPVSADRQTMEITTEEVAG
ncbi:hypothetical protein VPH35_040195 [Triticum aestivum]